MARRRQRETSKQTYRIRQTRPASRSARPLVDGRSERGWRASRSARRTPLQRPQALGRFASSAQPKPGCGGEVGRGIAASWTCPKRSAPPLVSQMASSRGQCSGMFLSRAGRAVRRVESRVPRTLEAVLGLRHRSVSAMCAIAALNAAAGCGHSSQFKWNGLKLTIPAGSSSRPTSVLGIRQGSSMGEVRRVFGPPQKDRHFGVPLGHCWLYHAAEKETTIDYLYVCFGRGQRVRSISYAMSRA
jgi:hypothetical protein